MYFTEQCILGCHMEERIQKGTVKMYTDEMEFNDFVLRVTRTTLHTTRQRVHSPAG